MLGRLPFDGEGLGDLLVRICTADPIAPSSIDPGVPPGFDEWVTRALAREPEKRFSSATELAEALCVVCGVSTRSAMGSLASSSGTQHAPSGGFRVQSVEQQHVTEVPLTNTLSGSTSRRPLLIGLAAAGVVAIIGMAALAMRGGGEAERSAASEPSTEPAPPPVAPPPQPERSEPALAPEVAPVASAATKDDEPEPKAEPSQAPPPPKAVLQRPPSAHVTPPRRPAAKARTPERAAPKPAEPAKPPPDLLGY
jgi:serine/threonine-protein kinase